MPKFVEVGDWNVAQLKVLQECASEVFDKVNQLNEAIKDAGEQGLIVTILMDQYQTAKSLVPYLSSRVSMEL
jgi:hypothetical protein